MIFLLHLNFQLLDMFKFRSQAVKLLNACMYLFIQIFYPDNFSVAFDVSILQDFFNFILQFLENCWLLVEGLCILFLPFHAILPKLSHCFIVRLYDKFFGTWSIFFRFGYRTDHLELGSSIILNLYRYSSTYCFDLFELAIYGVIQRLTQQLVRFSNLFVKSCKLFDSLGRILILAKIFIVFF